MRADGSLYNTRAWRRLRVAHLAREPLCRLCLAHGLHNDGSRDPDGTPLPERMSLVVDHVVPHRGDERLFLDPSNLQTLCVRHHAGEKTPDDVRGHGIRIGEDGLPQDPRHPFYDDG